MKITKVQAREEFNKLIEQSFKVNESELSNDFKKIRNILVGEYNSIKNKYSKPYDIDLNFGLTLYKLLNEELDLVNDKTLASNIDFWIFISLKLIPDIVFDRWGNQQTRFYSYNKRIWPLSIWWYIHLSWQGEHYSTYETLKDNSTDTIVQLIERVGVGYDLYLTRAIMSRLSKEEKKTQLFRRVMVLNTIYLQTIEPMFFKGSYEGYVNMLFDKAKI